MLKFSKFGVILIIVIITLILESFWCETFGKSKAEDNCHKRREVDDLDNPPLPETFGFFLAHFSFSPQKMTVAGCSGLVEKHDYVPKEEGDKEFDGERPPYLQNVQRNNVFGESMREFNSVIEDSVGAIAHELLEVVSPIQLDFAAMSNHKLEGNDNNNHPTCENDKGINQPVRVHPMNESRPN